MCKTILTFCVMIVLGANMQAQDAATAPPTLRETTDWLNTKMAAYVVPANHAINYVWYYEKITFDGCKVLLQHPKEYPLLKSEEAVKPVNITAIDRIGSYDNSHAISITFTGGSALARFDWSKEENLPARITKALNNLKDNYCKTGSGEKF